MAEVTLANSLREKMQRDEVAYTLSVKLVRSVELPMMAKTSGFDGILIDMEHSSFDLDTTSKQFKFRVPKLRLIAISQAKYALQRYTQALHPSFAYLAKIHGSLQECSTAAHWASLFHTSDPCKTPKTLLQQPNSSLKVIDHQQTICHISNTVISPPRSQIRSSMPTLLSFPWSRPWRLLSV